VNNNLRFIQGKPTNILEGFPLINCISLNESESRRTNLYQKFKQYNLERYKMHIFSRYTGGYNIIGANSEKVKLPHIGAITSHIQTIKNWLDTSNEEYAFFCEDDLSFETLDYWNFTWKEFMDKLPEDWEALQLCLISEAYQTIKFSERSRWDWGCQAYVLKRSYAEKLIDAHYKDNVYDLTIPGLDFIPCIEHVLFDGIGKVYNFPLFVEDISFESTYTSDRDVNTNAHDYILNWWKTANFYLPENFNS
jgi:GR25 family glycosyltransferase involved in LPS biosynthesis